MTHCKEYTAKKNLSARIETRHFVLSPSQATEIFKTQLFT